MFGPNLKMSFWKKKKQKQKKKHTHTHTEYELWYNPGCKYATTQAIRSGLDCVRDLFQFFFF